MPATDVLIPEHVLDFPKGLSLIQVFEVTVNDPPEEVTGALVYKDTAKVPSNTRFVEVSCVAGAMSIPVEDEQLLGVKEVGFEILKQPIAPGSSLFSFTFTVYPAWTSDVPWKGRFKLEFKCFGSP